MIVSMNISVPNVSMIISKIIYMAVLCSYDRYFHLPALNDPLYDCTSCDVISAVHLAKDILFLDGFVRIIRQFPEFAMTNTFNL